MMRRPVIVWVDDPEVTHIEVLPWEVHPATADRPGKVPVPRDDQLTRDVEALVGWAEAILDGKLAAYSGPKMRERFARLRAAYGLDQDQEDD